MVKKIGAVLLLSMLLVSCGGSKRASKRKVSVRSSRTTETPRSDRTTAPAETSRETERAYIYTPFDKV